eukprot:Nk52_evm39s1401 gene=Nk52_evmTU39s1401
MVLLAASICTKMGRAIISRQFVDMSRSRIEGLLAAFPKLVGTGKQHTFVETESVRYVYQPIEHLYVVLITTKNSNILEDLETLHLFARVIPEYCRMLTEGEVSENAFDLIFAFDEIIALGYRESVNLAQIRTFTEMDSHDEKVFQLVQKNKEKEAKEEAKRKMKELEQQRRDLKTNVARGFSATGGFGSNSSGGPGPMSASGNNNYGGGNSDYGGSAPSFSAAPRKEKPLSRGMKLGGKAKVNDFMDALESDVGMVPETPVVGGSRTKTNSESVPTESVHIRIEERISLCANRDGGLQNMEVKGDLFLVIQDAEKAKAKICLNLLDDKGFQFKTHPNVNKKLFSQDNIIGLKDPSRSFPTNSEQGVLKWRLQTSDESLIPLSINCWPSVNGDGTCDVNIEYELEQTHLVLKDVIIAIPIPHGAGSPSVESCDGQYDFNSRHGRLEWSIPLIDENETSGSMEFSLASCSDANALFPVSVDFVSNKTCCEFVVDSVLSAETEEEFKYSIDTLFVPDSYEVV